MIQQLLVAGNQTTTHLLGEMLLLLEEHPEEWKRLTSDPKYGSSVAEEALRLAAPTQGMFRVATEKTQIDLQRARWCKSCIGLRSRQS